MKTLAAFVILLSAFGIFFGTLNCSPKADPATAHAPGVSRELSLAFAGAVSSLAVLDALEANRLAKMPTATPVQLAAAERRVDRLRHARDALKIARAWVAGERDDGKAALADAFETLNLVVAELKTEGITVPADVVAGLAALQGYLGE